MSQADYDYAAAIAAYTPRRPQEAADQTLMLDCMRQYGPALLTRQVAVAHLTVSGWVMNAARSRVLLAHHNLYGCWAWPGGHADGDPDLLAVAQREVREETGVRRITVPSRNILSLDALPVQGHVKNGRWVSAHLHLNVTYLLLCEEDEPLHHREGENTAVAWFDTACFTEENFSAADTALYAKLIERARAAQP